MGSEERGENECRSLQEIVEEGKRLMAENRFSAAEMMLRAAQNRDRANHDVLFELGKLYHLQGRHVEAIELFNRLLADNAFNAHVIVFLAKSLMSMGDYEGALRALEKGAGAAGESADAAISEVEELSRMVSGCMKEARQANEDAVKFPETKKEEGAKTGYGAAAAHETPACHRDDCDLKVKLATACRERGDSRKALEILGTVSDEERAGEALSLEKGKNYRLLGKYEQALAELMKAGKRNPSDASIHLFTADIYHKMGIVDGACEEIGRYLEKTPAKDNPFLLNWLNNAIEMMQKKTVLDTMPTRLIVSLTTRCNLRCIMCSSSGNSWELPHKVADEIVTLFPYLEYVQWRGGEVFLWKGFERMFVEAAKFRNVCQCINTNGLFIDEQWADRLVTSYVKLDLSIDGMTKETYEYVRRGARYEDLLKKLEMLRDARQAVRRNGLRDRYVSSMNFVAMKSNYKDIERVIDFAEEYDIDIVQLSPLFGFGDGDGIFRREDIAGDPTVMEHVGLMMPGIRDKASRAGIILNDRITGCINPGGATVPELQKRHGAADTADVLPVAGCQMPWQMLFVRDDGKVFPHCYCKADVGTVESETLLNIWNNERMQVYRNKVNANARQGLCSSLCLSGMADDILAFDILRGVELLRFLAENDCRG